MAELTKFSRGFGANHRGDQRRKKAKLGRKIDAIDARTDRGGGGVLDAMDWENKYKLGEELVLVYKQEELYWQRGCEMDIGGGLQYWVFP